MRNQSPFEMLTEWLEEDKYNRQICGMFWAGQWICELAFEDEGDMHMGIGVTVDAAIRAAVEKARKG